MFELRNRLAKTIFFPSCEILMLPTNGDGVVIASGLPSVFPDSWSIRTRHRFMLPTRSLTKYKCRPSGDQTGLESTAASSVTATGSVPLADKVQRSRCDPLMAQ